MIEETNINNKPFIIGAGLGRTGTFSLKVALEQLNFGPCYHGFLVTVKDHSDYWYQVLTMKNKEKFDFEQIFKEYNSTTDFPAGHFWEDILKAYPNSKVILTVRDSAEDWYKSITETFLMVNLNLPFGILFYTYLNPIYKRFARLNKTQLLEFFKNDFSKENMIKTYNEHNQNVIYKCPKDKLLIFNVKQGWEPLCKFLGVEEIPKEPFPKLNEKDDMNKFLTELNRKGLLYFGLFSIMSALSVVGCGFLLKKYYFK